MGAVRRCCRSRRCHSRKRHSRVCPRATTPPHGHHTSAPDSVAGAADGGASAEAPGGAPAAANAAANAAGGSSACGSGEATRLPQSGRRCARAAVGAAATHVALGRPLKFTRQGETPPDVLGLADLDASASGSDATTVHMRGNGAKAWEWALGQRPSQYGSVDGSLFNRSTGRVDLWPRGLACKSGGS